MSGPEALSSTETLLMSGGDSRILLDPVTGVTPYGCRFYPDPDLVALGSSTASIISEAGFEAADALRKAYLRQLGQQSPSTVYAIETERLQSELLRLCGFSKSDGVKTLFAASGTDIYAIVAQWLRPSRVLMVASSETGSGVLAAIQGARRNTDVAGAGLTPASTPLNNGRSELLWLSPRTAAGDLRAPALVDAECIALADQAAARGETVLLVLTDVSKTGLIVPGVQAVLALKRRWPGRIEVLVDACQFRLSAATLRAYVSHGFIVALTGSKFVSGPTFCGALIALSSVAADRPAGRLTDVAPSVVPNVGLLLRWEAALTELRRFYELPDRTVSAFLREFASSIRASLRRSDNLEELPVYPIFRQILDQEESWDTQQTIFPFLLFTQDGQGRRPLTRDEAREIHRDLMKPPAGSTARPFQLGQPVECGERDGIPVSALRLCVSARMVVAACNGARVTVIADACAALTELQRMLGSRSHEVRA